MPTSTRWTSRNAMQGSMNQLNSFLNPPRGSMDGPTYASLKAQRAQMWANFVKNHQ